MLYFSIKLITLSKAHPVCSFKTSIFFGDDISIKLFFSLYNII